MKNKVQEAPKRIDLRAIKDPKFLSELNYHELHLLSEDIREEIINITSKNGGHIASNLGVVEPTIALCRSFDFSKDKIIFDVGHQCYTYKILTGRSLERLRKKDGISGFQKINESPYDHFECGHSSTSISAALGMAYVRDMNKDNYDIIAFIGDSSFVNGLSLEALNAGSENNNKIIIVLNDNDMSISKPVGGFSRFLRKLSTSNFYLNQKISLKKRLTKTRFGRNLYKVAAKFKNFVRARYMNKTVLDKLGYAFIGPIDGYDIKAMEKAFARAKKTTHSVVVVIKTIKGKGYLPAENDKEGLWHGVSSFDKKTGELPPQGLNNWSTVYGDLVLKMMREDMNSISIVAATEVGSCIQEVHNQFPNRFIDVGIAEEHALTLSSAIAVSGKHPIVTIYSTFLQRAYDNISHDLARLNCNATILIDRAGLVGADGDTHQGLYDVAFLYSIPNTVITMASRVSEAEDLMNESYKSHGVFCIRFPKEKIIKDEDNTHIEFGKWKWEINNNNEQVIVSVGPLTLKLKELILNGEKKVDLVNAIYLKPLDEECIKRLLKYKKIVIYDPYGVVTGFANMFAAKLMEFGYKGEITFKAVPLEFVKFATIDEQREQYNLLPEQVLAVIK